MKKNMLYAAPAIALVLAALTACNGSDGKNDDSSKPEKAASPAQSAPDKDRYLTAGQSVTGKVKEDDAAVTYDVAAQKIKIGTEADTKKMVQDPEQAKGMVPATAYLKFTHKAGPALTGTSDAADPTRVFADGRRGALVIGAPEDGPGCEDPLDIEGWKSGESHVLCETYLVPKGAKALEVQWAEKEDGGTPHIWKFDAAGK